MSKELNKFFCWFVDDLIDKEWDNTSLCHRKSLDFDSFRIGFYNSLRILDLIEDPENFVQEYYCKFNKDASISETEGT